MDQLSRTKTIFYHLYPGIIITAGFICLTPVLVRNHYPPQLSLLFCVIVIALPLMIAHLFWAKRNAGISFKNFIEGHETKLSNRRLMLYSIGLVVLAFLIWGLTQPLNTFIHAKLFYWLPDWYTTQDLRGYGKKVIRFTLICNLILNGLLAPVVEEIYFRGYLLPRMKSWGKWAFVVNAILFSLYHFWQPYVYITLVIALLPMVYMVYKTKDVRLAIITHGLLNLVGALLSFGAANK